MNKKLKKELIQYCERNESIALGRLKVHEKKYKKTGKRPIGLTGKDLINLSKDKAEMYRSGITDLKNQ